MKRLFLIFILLGTVLPLFGCGEQASWDEPPTIRVLTLGGGNSDTLPRISEALSEITMEKIGCRVELSQTTLSEYEALIVEKRFSGDFPDLFVSMDKLMLSQLVQEGWAASLEEELISYPELAAEINDDNFWKSVSLNGKRYAMPFNSSYEYCFGFMMREDICIELGIEPEQIETLDELYEALELVQRNYPDMAPVAPNFNIFTPGVSWDQMGDNIGVIMYREQTLPKVELLMETQEFYDWCKTMYRWNQEGLIMENVAFNIEPRQEILAYDTAFGGFARIKNQTLYNQKLNTGLNMVYARLSENRIDMADSDQSFCLFSGSELRSYAMDFLQLLYTDTQVLELCIYGQQGIDYDISEQDKIIPPINSPLPQKQRYVITTWCWPNRDKVRSPQSDNGYEVFEEGGARESPAVGFVFDDTAVRSKMNICQSIVDKYVPALMAGQLDPDTVIPILLQELKQAGIDDIIAEKQRQLDPWMALYGS